MLQTPLSARIQQKIYAAMPFAFSSLFFLFLIGFVKISGFHKTMPLIMLQSVFYWSAFSPALIPFSVTMLLGLIQDSFATNVFGLSAIFLILSRLLTIRYLTKLSISGFTRIWLAFALLSCLNCAGYYIYFMIKMESVIPLKNFLFQLLFTILTYPLMHILHTAIFNIISNHKLAR